MSRLLIPWPGKGYFTLICRPRHLAPFTPLHRHPFPLRNRIFRLELPRVSVCVCVCHSAASPFLSPARMARAVVSVSFFHFCVSLYTSNHQTISSNTASQASIKFSCAIISIASRTGGSLVLRCIVAVASGGGVFVFRCA